MELIRRRWVCGIGVVAFVAAVVILTCSVAEYARLEKRRELRVWYEDQRAKALDDREHLLYLARLATAPEEIPLWQRTNARSIVENLVLLPGETELPYEGPNPHIRRGRVLKALLASDVELAFDKQLNAWRITTPGMKVPGESPHLGEGD